MIIKWDITIPQLSGDQVRKAYVYLPESYEEDPERRYPVMYLFDGHNVFFDEDATYGTSRLHSMPTRISCLPLSSM